MEDKMLCTMASDLGITKYKHETAIQYRHRVLYSASACWIKAASMDRPVTVDPTVSLGTSRRHIIDKCSAVLEELLKRYPNCRMWFEPEGSTEKPIPIIRSRLLRHGDLVNVGFDTNLALTASQHIPLTRELGCTKGAVIQRGNMYSGLAMVYPICDTGEYIPETIISVVDWFTEYIKAAWWQQTDSLDENIQYFNPYKHSRNNHACWQTTAPSSVNNVILIRRSVNINTYEYLLYKPDAQKIHRIDPFMQEQGEHRRFMIGMRVLADNPLPIQVTQYSDHVSLKLWIHLPVRENILLESYAWPHSSIADRLEWDMPGAVWGYIKPHMLRIGLEIMEGSHG